MSTPSSNDTLSTPASTPAESAHSSSEVTGDNSHPRLPCRGCMPDCPNYATCDGMPWRKAS